ncbi:hypothetical protein ALI44B_06460 [Leifsonia sp. ALI-44-B]|nr:hypothetical protein ALI44B_06460 [Leifsonia sp. ALI-44-B]
MVHAMTDLGDVAREGVLIAGGGRAILLQIADPRIGVAVAAHSNFSERPLDRLNGTLSFVYAQVFGSEEERRETARRVNHAHGPVHSDPPPRRGSHEAETPGRDESPTSSHTAGGPHTVAYNAFDADAQLWVAATLYDTAIQMFERIFEPLSPADAERVYQGYAVLGTALQVPEGAWPTDRAAFQVYWAERMSELTVTPEARRVAADLLHPRRGPIWLKAGMPLARLVTVGLLDDRLREAFGFRWSRGRQRRFDAAMRMTRAIWPRLPRVIRTAPRDLYLRRLRVSRSSAA